MKNFFYFCVILFGLQFISIGKSNIALAETCPIVQGKTLIGSWDEGDYGQMELTVKKVDATCKIAEVVYGRISYSTFRSAEIMNGYLIVPCGAGEGEAKDGTCRFIKRGSRWDASYSDFQGRSNFGTFKEVECQLCDMKMQNPDSTAGLDIDTTAKKLIEEWGENAAADASIKAINSEEVGDLESKATWLKIKARVEELQKP